MVRCACAAGLNVGRCGASRERELRYDDFGALCRAERSRASLSKWARRLTSSRTEATGRCLKAPSWCVLVNRRRLGFSFCRAQTGEEVTIFTFEKKQSGTDLTIAAKNYLQKLKTVRHPNVLK